MQRTQFIIVRHGETEWNIAGIRQGHLDSRLTGKGMAQAKALAQRLAREKFTRALQQRSWPRRANSDGDRRPHGS